MVKLFLQLQLSEGRFFIITGSHGGFLQRLRRDIGQEGCLQRALLPVRKRILMGIAVIGPVFVDLKGYPLSTYISGGRNMGRIETVHGGVSRNVAEDLGNLGLRPVFVSLVDTEGNGTDVFVRLAEHGVETRYIRQVRDGMGLWLAVFDDTGNVVASVSKRPDFLPVIETIQKHGEEIFAHCDSIALEIDMDPGVVEAVLAYAEKFRKDVYAVVSNMTIALERKAYMKKLRCMVCNLEEAGLLFSDDYSMLELEEFMNILPKKREEAGIPGLVVTMGPDGAVYSDRVFGEGYCPAEDVRVIDTTGAGDSFFAGVCAGLTYGKTLSEACGIGARLAASVITTVENVCPRIPPETFGLPGQGSNRE